MPHRSRKKTLTIIMTVAGVAATYASSSFGATGSTDSEINHRIAKAAATDPAARQIVRTVANETLKTISTKDSISLEPSVVERLEDPGPIMLPAKIETGAAPGTRVPAAEEESVEIKAEGPREPAAAVETSPKPATPLTNISAEKALEWLQNGNKRFLKKTNRNDGKAQADRDRVSKIQKPHAIILSCSDSNVPPETVFDQALGEVFVVRTVGTSLDSAVIASLEFAVKNLGPQLLVVMGHTSCSAVHTAVTAHDGESLGSASLDLLVADIRPRLPSRGPAGTPSKNLEIESSANAQGVAADLMTRSSVIRSFVEKGQLVIKPALYDTTAGSVKFY